MFRLKDAGSGVGSPQFVLSLAKVKGKAVSSQEQADILDVVKNSGRVEFSNKKTL